MRRTNKAQSTLEYAVIIAVVAGGLLAMQYYMQRGIQGKLRSSSDSIGEQYSANKTTYKYTTNQTAMTTKEEFGVVSQGLSRYEITTPATVTRTAKDADAENITGLSTETLF